MKVEILGLPGSGKTAASRLAAERLGIPFCNLDQRRDYEATRLPRVRMAYERATSMARFPRLVASGASVARSTGRREFLGAAITAARRSKAFRSCSAGFLDEGPRHGLCAFIARNADLEEGGLELLDRVRSSLPTPDLTLWVRCDPDVAWERYQARSPHRRFPPRSGQDLTSRFERYQLAAAQLLGGPMITVDTSHVDVDEAAEEIAQAINTA